MYFRISNTLKGQGESQFLDVIRNMTADHQWEGHSKGGILEEKVAEFESRKQSRKQEAEQEAG